jgi:hypothetical protein
MLEGYSWSLIWVYGGMIIARARDGNLIRTILHVHNSLRREMDFSTRISTDT